MGNSFPSNLTLIKCIANANSSSSKNPSASTSDNFQILLSTEFGNLDLISSDLAAKYEKKNSFRFTLLVKKLVKLCKIYQLQLFFHRLDLRPKTLDRFGHDLYYISNHVHQTQHRYLHHVYNQMVILHHLQHLQMHHLIDYIINGKIKKNLLNLSVVCAMCILN